MSKPSTTFSELEDGWSYRMPLRLRQLVSVEPGEMRAPFWSFVYFFGLLCSYHIIRPMRDEMGISGGIDKLQWMFSGTFLVMLAAVPLFGWVAKRFPVRQFLPYVYCFFYRQPDIVFCFIQIGCNSCLGCASVFHPGQCL